MGAAEGGRGRAAAAAAAAPASAGDLAAEPGAAVVAEELGLFDTEEEKAAKAKKKEAAAREAEVAAKAEAENQETEARLKAEAAVTERAAAVEATKKAKALRGKAPRQCRVTVESPDMDEMEDEARSCMCARTSFLTTCIWKGFGAKSKMIEKIHASIL